MRWKEGTFHSPTVMTFAERKWQQFPSWRTDSSLCGKSPATDFGEVRAISSFQSSLATVLAPSQTKHFSRGICRNFQSGNGNIREKATISGCCWFACFGSASECLLWNSTFKRLSWFNSSDTYSTHWTTESVVSVWRKNHGAQSWRDGCEGPSQEHRSYKHSVYLPSVSSQWLPWRRQFFKIVEVTLKRYLLQDHTSVMYNGLTSADRRHQLFLPSPQHFPQTQKAPFLPAATSPEAKVLILGLIILYIQTHRDIIYIHTLNSVILHKWMYRVHFQRTLPDVGFFLHSHLSNP